LRGDCQYEQTYTCRILRPFGAADAAAGDCPPLVVARASFSTDSKTDSLTRLIPALRRPEMPSSARARNVYKYIYLKNLGASGSRGNLLEPTRANRLSKPTHHPTQLGRPDSGLRAENLPEADRMTNDQEPITNQRSNVYKWIISCAGASILWQEPARQSAGAGGLAEMFGNSVVFSCVMKVGQTLLSDPPELGAAFRRSVW